MGEPFEKVAKRVDRFWPIIDRVAQKYHVSQALIMAMIHWESGGNPNARRDEPAIRDTSYGLMQVLKGTASGVMRRRVLAKELYDPTFNIEVGVRYLVSAYNRWKNWGLALAHYNGGPLAAERMRRGEAPASVARYVEGVRALWQRYKRWNKDHGRA